MIRIPVSDKKKPGPNFILNLPIRYSISSNPETFRKFKNNVSKNNTNITSQILNGILSYTNSENINDWLKDDKILRKNISQIKERIAEIITEGRAMSFSSLICEMMEAYNDEQK